MHRAAQAHAIAIRMPSACTGNQIGCTRSNVSVRDETKQHPRPEIDDDLKIA